MNTRIYYDFKANLFPKSQKKNFFKTSLFNPYLIHDSAPYTKVMYIYNLTGLAFILTANGD